MEPRARRVFVLADTHDHLPERVEKLAEDADEIWHLGDVCLPNIFSRLAHVGPPVTLVRGNCDGNYEWPLVIDLKRNGVRLRLVHIPPARVPEDVDVVLHAHTHVPRQEKKGGVLFLNPGCVTRPNRGAPPSVANLEISSSGKISWSLTMLR